MGEETIEKDLNVTDTTKSLPAALNCSRLNYKLFWGKKAINNREIVGMLGKSVNPECSLFWVFRITAFGLVYGVTHG